MFSETKKHRLFPEAKNEVLDFSIETVKNSLIKNSNTCTDNWVITCDGGESSDFSAGEWEVTVDTSDFGLEIFTRMAHLEKELEDLEQRDRKRLLRCLIEVSRKQLWESWFDQYYSQCPDEIENRYEVEKLRADVTVPKSWGHFVHFVKTLSDDITDTMAELLVGGKISAYGVRSSIVHQYDEDEILEAIEAEECMSGYKELYEYVDWKQL